MTSPTISGPHGSCATTRRRSRTSTSPTSAPARGSRSPPATRRATRASRATASAREEATLLLRRSVELARAARERRVAELEAAGEAVPRLLVAASIGPYGAMLADGQEYEGNYGRTREELAAFHRPRIAALLAARPDLLAFETIPSQLEAEALVDVLAEHPGVPAWLAYSCRDGAHTCEGQPIEEAVAVAERSPQVVAVGLNCTPARSTSTSCSSAPRPRPGCRS